MSLDLFARLSMNDEWSRQPAKIAQEAQACTEEQGSASPITVVAISLLIDLLISLYSAVHTGW